MIATQGVSRVFGKAVGASPIVIDCGQVEKAPGLSWIKERPKEYP
jgi:hypothetical protein